MKLAVNSHGNVKTKECAMRTNLGLAAAVLLVAACGGTTATAPPTTDPTPVVIYVTPEPIPQGQLEVPTPEPVVEVEPDPTEEPTPAPATLVPVGKSVRVGDWAVKVTGKANFDAWKKVKAENQFNDPAPKGWKMVLVPLAITNRGEEPMILLGEMGYVVGNATGIERTDFDDPTCGVIPNELDAFTTLRPGGTLKGNMCFVVEAADVKTLRMGWPAGMFSDEPDVEFALR